MNVCEGQLKKRIIHVDTYEGFFEENSFVYL